MLGSNYLTFAGVDLPNPVEFSISFENIENKNQSEAGTDLINVVRLKKRTFSAKFQCSSFWAGRIATLCSLNYGTLVYQSESITATARLKSTDLEENSERIPNTDGLWTVNVDFTEV